MSHTTYTDNSTPFVAASWLNDVDTVVYTYFGNGVSLNSPTKLTVASVVTPLVDATGALLLRSGGTGSLQFSSATGLVSSNSDNTTTLGSAALRWSTIFTPIIDSGSGSLVLKGAGTTALTVTGANMVASGTSFAISNTTPSLFLTDPSFGTGILQAGVNSGGTGTGNFLMFNVPSGKSFTFAVNNVSKANLDSTGIFTVTTSVVTPLIAATSGSPAIVYAGAGGSGTPTSHTLSMYEEGTWTPSLGGTTTYIGQTGTYTRIGRIVFIQGTLSINVIGTGSTSTISGLPFTNIAEDTPINIDVIATSATNIISANLMINSSASTATIRSRVASSAGDAINAIFANSTLVRFSGCYHTT